ncbi:hypothetical protein [Bradyrhizobium liaoningense]
MTNWPAAETEIERSLAIAGKSPAMTKPSVPIAKAATASQNTLIGKVPCSMSIELFDAPARESIGSRTIEHNGRFAMI